MKNMAVMHDNAARLIGHPLPGILCCIVTGGIAEAHGVRVAKGPNSKACAAARLLDRQGEGQGRLRFVPWSCFGPLHVEMGAGGYVFPARIGALRRKDVKPRQSEKRVVKRRIA